MALTPPPPPIVKFSKITPYRPTRPLPISDCRGTDEDKTEEKKCSVFPGWQEWTDDTDCSQSCDGGIYTRSRLCADTQETIVDHADHPDLCPGDAVVTGVPCNALPCIPPVDCPASHRYALNNGNTCCKYDLKKNTVGQCDGTKLLADDPVECCLNDETSPCEPGKFCVTRSDASSYCQRLPSKTQHNEPFTYAIDDSAAADFFSAESQCESAHEGTPVTIRDQNSVTALRAFLADKTPDFYWINLRPWFKANVVCVNSTCDDKLSWGIYDENAFAFDIDVKLTFDLAETDADAAISICAVVNKEVTEITDRACNDVSDAYAACQTDCRFEPCPVSKPYATNSGQTCCEQPNKRISSSDAKCDGRIMEFDDPAVCCFSAGSCANSLPYGCQNNNVKYDDCKLNWRTPRVSTASPQVEY